ncbi:MAG: ABC transporter permease subunit [Proteobacteria bacterium]|nr:ABC transporter permease subunit [Pseudomonadota bacterium]
MTAITTSETSIPPSAGVSKKEAGWIKYWPIFPVMAYLGLFFIYPVAQLLWLSVVDKGGDLTTMHYAKLFASTTYARVIGITFRIAAWTTLLSVLAAYPVAYLLSTSSERIRNNLLLWVLMPFWTSFLVRTFAWMVLLGRNGTINDLLQRLGIIDAPAHLIYNFAGVMIGMVHALMPLCVMTMLAVMRNIDSNLPRAAATLGARGGQSFWRVYFPLSIPGVASGALLVFIVSLGFFITPALLGSGREIMIAQVIIEQIEELLNWSFAGAVAVLLLATTLVAFFLYDRLLGMSTMSAGGGGSTQIDRKGVIGRIGAWVGMRCIAIMGFICDKFGEAWEVVRPVNPAKPRTALSRKVLWVVSMLVVFYLAVPSFFVIPVSFSENTFIQWPPKGFSTEWYDAFLSSPLWFGAMVRSFVVGIISAFMAMAIGVPAAFVLARQNMAFKGAVFAMVLAPMIIPHIIIAISLFYFYAQVQHYLPFNLIGETIGLVLGHVVVSLPFVVVTIVAVLKNYDQRLDQAAMSLGATKWKTLRHVTFPLITPGLIAAFLFAFVISLDELTIALFISGGSAPTLPKQMWVDAILKVSPTVTAVSTVVLVVVTGLILVAEYARRVSERRAR